MLDFLKISKRLKNRCWEIYPTFMIKKSSDLMIRGGDFYAVWLEDVGLWSTDEHDVLQLIDRELDKYAEENKNKFDTPPRVLHMWDAETKMIDSWHHYCQKQCRDSFHTLDEKIIFSNQEVDKKDYASKKLPYPLEEGSITAYDHLMSVLYSPEERHKIEWAIGACVTGASKKIQKFLVLYGSAGTGKSTVLNIIQQLFEGYYCVFDAKALGSSNNAFALEAFKSDPLVAIQHDGDLSRIEDNTRLNSLVSHELMTVNEKFKATYSTRFKAFLFMGTNKPVKITDAKSGLLRRLIDVTPSGNKLSPSDYKKTVKQINFELGAIACHCRDVYLEDTGFYDDYIPISMIGASNDFYNFVLDSYFIFKNEDGTTLKAAWEMYKTYCEDAKVGYPFSQRVFKEELKSYFKEHKERYVLEDGTRVRNYYVGFRSDKFDEDKPEEDTSIEEPNYIIKFEEIPSLFDKECADLPAQYASTNETPLKKWSVVTSKLSEIDTSKLHYVKVPTNHIVIDFDLKDEDGNKCFEKNLAEASKWPQTYAETSKSGNGIHLHYIYTGDATKLARIYAEDIEIKVFAGRSSLRRKLTKCNNLPIATISSGLPMKGEKKVVNSEGIKSEKGLRNMIMRNLEKEIHPNTKCSIDFIDHILNEAYDSGLKYDVTDMRQAVFTFAAKSTHNAQYCIKTVNRMKFKSKEPSENKESPAEAPIIFFDVEIFPNLFLVNWKFAGEDQKVHRMINPTPAQIEEILKYRLIGFNNRRYDNHMLYACLMGYTVEQLYRLSQKIVNGKNDKNKGFFGEAYNLSYTDVYDFCAKKQSLKKWEIELGIHHQELGLPWDQPVPEEMWEKVAEYCDNDVIATEAVFNHNQADFTARKILADVAGMTVNDTTNSLTTRIIFGKDRNPQNRFNYRFMGEIPIGNIYAIRDVLNIKCENITHYDYTVFDLDGRPWFPGYKFEKGISTYRGEEVGEGGYVYAEPGMYGNVALLDIASMHPSTIVAEQLFGPEYTARFNDILQSRIAIKHKDFDKAKTMLNGKLAKYLTDPDDASNLAQALKIAINSVYGLTAATFSNPFHDPRNVDNIVAKRGALFMINLKHEVQNRGFTVAHIKTDSIKIPDATPEIIQFVMEYGKLYGYNFEHEATYERMCLVNNSVYIAKYKDGKHAGEWTATGAQFAVPYVMKTLFTKEPIEFSDLCETKSVTSALYLDMNEGYPDVTDAEKEFAAVKKKINKLKKDSGDDLQETAAELSDLTTRKMELSAEIAKGHNYIFIGKVGLFCPMENGVGGGLLVRENNGEFHAATGSKEYRWLEAEYVRENHMEDKIARSYYDDLVQDAVANMVGYGDVTWFTSDDPYIGPEFEKGEYMNRPVYEDELPFK